MNSDELQHVHVVPVIRSYAENIGRFLDLGKLNFVFKLMIERELEAFNKNGSCF